MAKKLRKHQRAALRYAVRTPHPALFLEMRLGKTLVAIRRCKLLKPAEPLIGLRVLVAAPSSALGSWERECVEEDVNVVWLTGSSKKKRREKLLLLTPGFHLINKEGWIALPEIAAYPWDAVIIDESTFIKNPTAKVTKFFLKNFREAQLRMILSGTPAPESPADFCTQFLFLYGRAFGCNSFWDFRQQFMEPHPAGYGWEMKPGASDAVRRQVGRRACVIQRRDVGYEEQRVYERRVFDLPKKLRSAYDELEAKFEVEYEDKVLSTKWGISKYAWLRQLCGGFIEGDKVWNGKAEEIANLAAGELAGEQIVVWCNFNAEIQAVTEALERVRVSSLFLRGEINPKIRRSIVNQFQNGDVRVLVLQQAVAQTGMDLSAADTAIYYSTPIGGFARAQTEDRILSLEKVDKGTPMLFIDLVVRDSVDEDVMELLADKKKRSEISLRRALQRAMKERKKWTNDL